MPFRLQSRTSKPPTWTLGSFVGTIWNHPRSRREPRTGHNTNQSYIEIYSFRSLDATCPCYGRTGACTVLTELKSMVRGPWFLVKVRRQGSNIAFSLPAARSKLGLSLQSFVSSRLKSSQMTGMGYQKILEPKSSFQLSTISARHDRDYGGCGCACSSGGVARTRRATTTRCGVFSLCSVTRTTSTPMRTASSTLHSN